MICDALCSTCIIATYDVSYNVVCHHTSCSDSGERDLLRPDVPDVKRVRHLQVRGQPSSSPAYSGAPPQAPLEITHTG